MRARSSFATLDGFEIVASRERFAFACENNDTDLARRLVDVG
tara:strand:- start:1423 stop:1548 length:126 start_codon:yes stop_codon:yes gene_type:complete